MQHITSTPFGRRPVSAGLLAAQKLAEQGPSTAQGLKWQVLSDLTHARAIFGVTDRDLSVLQALVSFWREDEIPATGAIVFPSNAALSQRAHGMAESTLRRHIAALVAAGLIQRHDSPNGKRFSVRGYGEALDRSFGFDLAPLARRFEEIGQAAREARFAQERLRRLRETVVLRLRDCEKLLSYGIEHQSGPWETFAEALALTRRMLRRKMELGGLLALDEVSVDLLERINQALKLEETEEMDGNVVQNERHIQYSSKDSIDLELCQETAKAEPAPLQEPKGKTAEPALPLHLILRACPDILPYATGGLRDWRDLIGAAAFARGMMGISQDAWDEACYHMGAEVAAVVVAAILQGIGRIERPGGYLRALSRKAAEGGFSPGPMVMALLRAENTRAV